MIIIKTKILLPVINPRLLIRRQLLERLKAWPEKKLILLSAAAGSGKTSLINLWLQQLQQTGPTCCVAWYSLDEQDNDPARFFSYLLAALKQAGCFSSGSNMEWIADMQNLCPREAFSHILNQLIDEGGNKPLCIILDDYHYIRTPEINTGLDFFLHYLPSHVHLVILSRVDPPLNLAGIRLEEQLLELRSVDMNFSYDESRDFLQTALNKPPAEDTMAALYRKTEGWTAGLQLAALSLRMQKGPVDIQSTCTNSFVIDYLMEEVYSCLPDRMKQFLLQTSVLDRFTPDLCRAVTLDEQGREILTSLEQDNLFLISLDRTGTWFRYHHLFADLLQKRLYLESPGVVQQIHARAARWYQANNLIQEAFNHALQSKDTTLISGMARGYADELLIAGEHKLLLGRLQQIPDSLLQKQYRLQLYMAWMKMISGQVEEAMTGIRKITAQDDLDNTDRGILETIQAFYGNITHQPGFIAEHATRALELLGDHNPLWRCSALTILGYSCTLSGRIAAAESHFQIALRESSLNRNVFFALLAGFNLAFLLRYQGRLAEAKALCYRQLRELAEYGYPQLARTGGIYTILGDIACEENNLDTALKYGARGVELSEQGNNVPVLSVAYLFLVRIFYIRKEPAEMKMILNKLLVLQEQTFVPAWIASPIRVWQATLLFAEGRPGAALQQLQPAELLELPSIPYEKEMQALVLSRVLLTANKPDQAVQILDKLKDSMLENQRWMAYLNYLINYAVYQEQKRLQDKAEATLSEALELGYRCRVLRTFIDAGSLLQPIISRLKENQSLNDYGEKIWVEIQADISGNSRHQAPIKLAEALSHREQEILTMLPLGLGYPEMADKLCISYSTVRSHVKNIYNKLDAHSRLEAINIARQAGIFS